MDLLPFRFELQSFVSSLPEYFAAEANARSLQRRRLYLAEFIATVLSRWGRFRF